LDTISINNPDFVKNYLAENFKTDQFSLANILTLAAFIVDQKSAILIDRIFELIDAQNDQNHILVINALISWKKCDVLLLIFEKLFDKLFCLYEKKLKIDGNEEKLLEIADSMQDLLLKLPERCNTSFFS